MNHADVSQASRLVQHALNPNARPRTGSDYRALLDRFDTDTTFAEVVRTVAEGLGLYVQATSPLGLLVAGDADGPFRVTVDNAGLPIRSGPRRLQDRRCYGLVLAAIAAYAYPNGESLVETTNPTVRPADVERFLSRRIAAVAGAADGDTLVDDLDIELGEAARTWLDLPEVLPRDTGSGFKRDCRRAYVIGTLEFLVERGRARKEAALADDRGDAYALNDRFRIGLAEVAETVVFGVLAHGEDAPAADAPAADPTVEV
jgi:hypothetical protein